MTNKERARKLVEHCRYCYRLDDPQSKCTSDHKRDVQAVATALDEAEKRGAAGTTELQAAINETLRLADFLNDAAKSGAGFYQHWGERVMQVVEPLRDTKAFAGHTLEHNRSLLEYNEKLIEQLAAKDKEIDALRLSYYVLERKYNDVIFTRENRHDPD